MAADKLKELRELLSKISTAGGNVFLKPLEDPSIVPWFEESLDLRFPPSLSLFYSTFRYLEINVDEDAGSEVLRRAGWDAEKPGSSEYLRTGVLTDSSL